MNRALPLALLVALFAVNAAAQQDNGTLCFVSRKDKPVCNAAAGPELVTKADPSERTFVWSSADAKRIAFGIVPAGAEKIDLTEKALNSVALSVRGDQRHGWPTEIWIRIDDAKQKERLWIWGVPSKSANALTQLMLPPGRYVVTIAADHHLTFRRPLDLAKNVSLREVMLRPMPLVSGRVVGTKDMAVADAQILRDDGRVVATTDEQGNFRGEALELLPKSLLVSRSGFGSQVVVPQFATGDADLGVIHLGKPIKLALRIIRPDGNHDALKVRLARRPEAQYDYLVVGTKELKAADDTLDFDDLGKGKYSVIVEGTGSSEKLAADVTIDGSIEKEIRIEPYRLDGTASLGDDPMDGSLSVSMGGVPMQFSMPVADGRFTGTLWQHGKLFGWIKTEELGASEPVISPELGADPSPWNIRFPKRFIQGRVFDADSQQAISGATMELQRNAGQNSRLYTSVRIGDDGSFSILATKSGTYELKVSAPDHAQAKQIVEMRDHDGSVQKDFALRGGIPTVLEVVWPSGRPVANAPVSEGVASDGHNAERRYSLDASGRLTLRLQRGESKTLYVVPTEGSFAIAHVTAQEGSESAPIRLVAPDPAGSLKIEVTDAAGKTSGMSVGMRFNGEPVPTPVLFQIGFRASPGSLTDRTLLLMPAGAYDLWPANLRTSQQTGPTKSVTLLAGETTVALTVNP